MNRLRKARRGRSREPRLRLDMATCSQLQTGPRSGCGRRCACSDHPSSSYGPVTTLVGPGWRQRPWAGLGPSGGGLLGAGCGSRPCTSGCPVHPCPWPVTRTGLNCPVLLTQPREQRLHAVQGQSQDTRTAPLGRQDWFPRHDAAGRSPDFSAPNPLLLAPRREGQLLGCPLRSGEPSIRQPAAPQRAGNCRPFLPPPPEPSPRASSMSRLRDGKPRGVSTCGPRRARSPAWGGAGPCARTLGRGPIGSNRSLLPGS